ncbi:Protein O-linked-mannose beta-1,4-N-acetylglucosaminyltransferase 2 [Holothuria leucospilota]|uniref:Protein O-linked-mannose beta-1,4-N-acetylglucosaminyltransferase 2 n=1 Tax=Holothuria leucospilota TaxID=206669 RepID=A0A9Q1C2Y1_HOLLE|nr:Protein O-linked-mannose beta-1,4-N-acetylglucosaminyltransferase 2 [Holothuria leucospilota]
MDLNSVCYLSVIILLSAACYQYMEIGQFLPPEGIKSHKPMFEFLSEGSSFNCSKNSHQSVTCKFHNLCYAHADDAFIYVYSPNSKQVFVSDKFEYFATLPLTSAAHLNYYMKYLNLTDQFLEQNLLEENFIFKPGRYIIYSRFVAHNIFHLFHDELLPLFYTLHRHFEEREFSNIKLFIKDKADAGDIGYMYDLFSSDPPLFSFEVALETSHTLICFQEAIIGLARESTWFQFGFEEPEGPIKNSTATSKHIRQFTKYLYGKLNINPRSCKQNFGILLSRKKNRLLINEKELRTAVSDHFQVDMMELSLESNSLPYIIEKVSCAKLVIGVHGALLIMSMFLPPSSLVLEIFPYAMNPDHLTHYKTLVQLPGMDINYTFWRNSEKSKTITHPNALPSQGGIRHLSYEEQQRIMNVTEVPHNVRGADAEWRYFLYQDTIVDIPAVIDTLTRSGFENILSKSP